MSDPDGDSTPRLTWSRILGLLLLGVVLTTGATVLVVRSFLFAPAFSPVELSRQEEQALDEKLERLERVAGAPSSGQPQGEPPTSLRPRRPAADPQPYRENDSDRRVVLTEREVNALLARNTDLASTIAIDFSDDLVSANVLLPVDPEAPWIGGITIRVHAGVALAYENGRPVVILKGISLMGVPIPGAWLGGVKNIDLIDRYGRDEGFWKAFAAGVEHLRVEDGALEVELKD